MRSFTPVLISHQLTGNAVTNPASMASCMTAQNTAVSIATGPPNQAGNTTAADDGSGRVAYQSMCTLR